VKSDFGLLSSTGSPQSLIALRAALPALRSSVRGLAGEHLLGVLVSADLAALVRGPPERPVGPAVMAEPHQVAISHDRVDHAIAAGEMVDRGTTPATRWLPVWGKGRLHGHGRAAPPNIQLDKGKEEPESE
jgi:hypothetical protein